MMLSKQNVSETTPRKLQVHSMEPSECCSSSLNIKKLPKSDDKVSLLGNALTRQISVSSSTHASCYENAVHDIRKVKQNMKDRRVVNSSLSQITIDGNLCDDDFQKNKLASAHSSCCCLDVKQQDEGIPLIDAGDTWDKSTKVAPMPTGRGSPIMNPNCLTLVLISVVTVLMAMVILLTASHVLLLSRVDALEKQQALYEHSLSSSGQAEVFEAFGGKQHVTPLSEKRVEASVNFDKTGQSSETGGQSPSKLTSNSESGGQSPSKLTSDFEYKDQSPSTLTSDYEYEDQSPAELTSDPEYEDQYYIFEDQQYEDEKKLGNALLFPASPKNNDRPQTQTVSFPGTILSRRKRSKDRRDLKTITEIINKRVNRQLRKVDLPLTQAFIGNFADEFPPELFSKNSSEPVAYGKPCEPRAESTAKVFYKDKDCKIAFFKKISGKNLLTFDKTGEFTVKKTGLYLVDTNVTVINTTNSVSTNSVMIGLYVNGQVMYACKNGGLRCPTYNKGDPDSYKYRICHMSGLLHLNANDKISIRLMSENMAIRLESHRNMFFSIVQLTGNQKMKTSKKKRKRG